MKKILFNDNFGLTQAVLYGRKTMTRRICSFTLHEGNIRDELTEVFPERIYLDGDVWMFSYKGKEYRLPKENYPKYKVDEEVAIAQSYKDILEADNYKVIIYARSHAGYKNKMFVKADEMPHHICITDVCVERLQDISEEDCLREGVIKGRVGSENTHFMDAYYVPNIPLEPYCTPREAFAVLIDKVSGRGTWERNPYVFVYEFELID